MTGTIVGFVLSVSVQQMGSSSMKEKNRHKTQSHTETTMCIQRICAMGRDSEVSILHLNAGATRLSDFML